MDLLTQDSDSPPPTATGLCAQVLVPYPVDKAYSYAVPEHLDIREGDYVCVPLGKREVAGVVWGLSDNAGIDPAKLKAVIAKYDVAPMPESHRRFIDWVANYTMSAPGMVLKMSLSAPAALEPPKPVYGYRLAEFPASPHHDLPQSHAPSSYPSPPGGEGTISSPRRGEDQGEGASRPKPSQTATQRARSLRQNQTEAEKRLWYHIRNRQFLGYKFKRQFAIDPYITDFAAPDAGLIIEVDGGQHGDEADQARDSYLQSCGYTVLRFWNNEVLQNIEGVLQRIHEYLQDPPPQSSPLEKRGGSKEGAYKSLSPQARRVLEILQNGPPLRPTTLAEQAGCSQGVITKLAEKGYIEKCELYTPAPCTKPDPAYGGLPLTEQQQSAVSILQQKFDDGGFAPVLLDGVAGAGKTEAYFEAVARALEQGKQVLILLPEITLSNAFLERFEARFGTAPGLWHSALSSSQRKTTWRGVANGRTKVVVGARSALFLPYADLGLIVVDEEHDPAFKQEDNVIYNARDMAIVRAHQGGFPIVLVSATPSAETMANAWSGRYAHVQLPDRHGGASMPEIDIIDLREDKPGRGEFIAPGLHQSIGETLEAGHQALLFLNRRGYAPLTICRSCGHRYGCPRCTSWLVEHKRINRLMCHHCGYSVPSPNKCDECGEKDALAPCGPGVERIRDEVSAAFPDARLCLLASDTADSYESLRDILKQIADHEVDIIIGTQLIAKGHHFPDLALVGVVDADLGLQGGDLRAGERSYQLLHQVAGRAGREAGMQGQVYLQSWFPDNRVIQALAGGDRDGFLEVELAEREAAHMPPFSRLAAIIVSGKEEGEVEESAIRLGRCAPNGEGIATYGPAQAPIYRVRGRYRQRLLVQADRRLNIQKTIANWVNQVQLPSSDIRIYIDIDPQSFM